MSRKRLRTSQDENQRWYETLTRQREEAKRISEAQRQRMVPPGFRRASLDEDS